MSEQDKIKDMQTAIKIAHDFIMEIPCKGETAVSVGKLLMHLRTFIDEEREPESES